MINKLRKIGDGRQAIHCIRFVLLQGLWYATKQVNQSIGQRQVASVKGFLSLHTQDE